MPLRSKRSVKFYTREELDEFKRNNRDVRWALNEVRPYMRARDQRAFRHWVFVMGWIACLTYYGDALEKLVKQIAESAEKTGEKALTEWERRTWFGLPPTEEEEVDG